jgi:Ca2+-binding EF-hand superfamily protein
VENTSGTTFQEDQQRHRWKEIATQMKSQQHNTSEQWMQRRNLGVKRFTMEQKKTIHQWFMMLDTDEDRSLSVREMEDALISTGTVYSAEKVKHVIAKLDINQNGQVDVDEFTRVFEISNQQENGDAYECAKTLQRAIQQLKLTMSSIDQNQVLPPTLAVGIARRRASLELIENIYSQDTELVDQERIKQVRSARQRAMESSDQHAVRKATRLLNRLENQSGEKLRRRQTLSVLVPDSRQPAAPLVAPETPQTTSSACK